MLIDKSKLLYKNIEVPKDACINNTCPCRSKGDGWLYENVGGYNYYVVECNNNDYYFGAIREKTKGDYLKDDLKLIFESALRMVESDLLEKAVYKDIEDDCCTMTKPITTVKLYNDSLGVSVEINGKVCVDYDKY
jgi:TRAP-type mannitol/chloroaromatic compound transport system substrate-binding protein